jgi:hypothetical protein
MRTLTGVYLLKMCLVTIAFCQYLARFPEGPKGNYHSLLSHNIINFAAANIRKISPAKDNVLLGFCPVLSLQVGSYFSNLLTYS